MSQVFDKENRTYLVVNTSIDFRRLVFFKKENRYESRYRVYFNLKDDKGKSIRGEVWEETAVTSDYKDTRSHTLVSAARKRFSADPGEYKAKVMIEVVVMGHTELDVLQNISGLIRQVIEQEEQARQALLVQNKPMLEDKVFRSYGVLKNAHIISSQETVELLSMVRLGIDLDIVKDVDRNAINELFIMIQPAHLQKIEGKKLSASERESIGWLEAARRFSGGR